MSGEEDGTTKQGCGGVISNLLMLVLMSCILNLVFGGMSTGRPFSGDAASWLRLLQVVIISSIFALIPVVVMFLLSLLVGAATENVDRSRSYRDGLAAAWFFILAMSFGQWMASSSLPEMSRYRAVESQGL